MAKGNNGDILSNRMTLNPSLPTAESIARHFGEPLIQKKNTD
jgi:hypothetical protein